MPASSIGPMSEPDSIGSSTIALDFARDAVLDLRDLARRIGLRIEHDQLDAELVGGAACRPRRCDWK